ncbi:MAG TPA: ROK family protein [Bacilli bacterium]|nr:ROK family protein [Bacilli bacterium]
MNLTRLDKTFEPMILVLRQFQQEVEASKGKEPFAFSVERNEGYTYTFHLDIFSNSNQVDRNFGILERLIKSVLWVVGGYKIYLGGNKAVSQKLKDAFSHGGLRKFDVHFMERVYERPFEVVMVDYNQVPQTKACSIPVGGNLDGCRIGFDAGGSDRKVSAVIDGQVVYSEEVVWLPKVNSDPRYHYEGILDSFKRAASKMPRVDAIGISSAGIYIDNRVRVASLFLKVDEKDFDRDVKDIYIRAAKEIGDVPLEAANDGDVTALAGAMELKDNKVLGIAMGTSEAVGYINAEGTLNGWLSELAFVPVDFNPNSMEDEWSGDYGCGVKYFSQDSVIKLAPLAGITIDESLTPAEKLKVVQKLMANNDERARAIFETIGEYLGYSIPYYGLFYDIKHMLILGRVTSGEAGNIIIDKAKEVLNTHFKEFASINIIIPDEENRRVGQSIAAASLPKLRK